MNEQLSKCHETLDEYKRMYSKLRDELKEAKQDRDLEAELTCEALMRQMKHVIALLHRALDQDPLETLQRERDTNAVAE